MARENISNQIWAGAGDAIADVREKLEEAIWGRAVTERGDAPEWPKAEEPQIEPQGMNGEVLSPEHEPYSYAPGDTLLERGTVIEGQAVQWPEAQETQPTQMLEDHSRDVDIDR
jgi:hypothetical protein